MLTSTRIRKYIYGLAANTLFSTRDLLTYGKRSSVDQTIYRLIKDGHIVRIARGVFRRADYTVPLPSVLEVAACKAKAFDRQIVINDCKNQALSLLSEKNNATIYMVTGHSSSFQFGETTIRFQEISPRKIQLANKQKLQQFLHRDY